jgi:hypothetical protein
MSMPILMRDFPPPTAQERWRDDEHLRLLSIFHFVVGGLVSLGLPFLFIHFVVFFTFFRILPFLPGAQNGNGPPPEFFAIFVWFYPVMAFIIVVAAGLNFLSCWFIHQKKHRVFSLVVAGLNCTQIPWGAILGVFTIVVLARPSVKWTYETPTR